MIHLCYNLKSFLKKQLSTNEESYMQIILRDQKFFLFFSDALLLSLINLVG